MGFSVIYANAHLHIAGYDISKHIHQCFVTDEVAKTNLDDTFVNLSDISSKFSLYQIIVNGLIY